MKMILRRYLAARRVTTRPLVMTSSLFPGNLPTGRSGRMTSMSRPVKRTTVQPFQYNASGTEKKIEEIFLNQKAMIDRLTAEREDLNERCRSLEERLSNSLAMIAVQKARIVNLSRLSSSLASVSPRKRDTHTQQEAQEPVVSDENADLVLEALTKITPDQIPTYLAHNPFIVQCAMNDPLKGDEDVQTILKKLEPGMAVQFASAAFTQMFRACQITEIVQTLRKSTHNREFLHSIEAFSRRLFRCAVSQLFVLQPQQNQMVGLFDDDGFTLQIPFGRGIVGSCANNGQVLMCQSTRDAEEYDPEIDSFFKIETNPSLLIPVFDHSSNFVIAVILVHSPEEGVVFRPEDLRIGETLAMELSPFVTSYVEHMEKNQEKEYRSGLSYAQKALLGRNDLGELLGTLLTVVQKAARAEEAELYVVDQEQGSMFVFQPQMSENGKTKFARKYFSGKAGVPFHVVESLSVFNVPRLSPETCEFFSRETDAEANGKPYLAVPVFGLDKKPIAVLAVYGKVGANFFSPLDCATLQQIGIQVGINLTNVFTTQEIEAAGGKADTRSNAGFDKPLRQCQKQLEDGSGVAAVCAAVAKEAATKLNCDLIAIWEVNGESIKQQCILKSQNTFDQIVSIPPCVTQAANEKKVIQAGVAIEVKALVGDFDHDAHYKSLSNLTLPVIENGMTKWVVMAENTLSPLGHFSDADVKALEEYSTFLLVSGEACALHGKLKECNDVRSIMKHVTANLAPLRADMISRLLKGIADQVHAKHYGLYQIDSLSSNFALVDSDCPEAPKKIGLSEGLLGKAGAGEVVVSGDLSHERDFVAATDAFGLDNISSGLYTKFGQSFALLLLADEKGAFEQSSVACIHETVDLFEHAYEISKNLRDVSSAAPGVSGDQKKGYMTKASNTTKAEIEEYSARLFNVKGYSDDERTIMLLKMFVSQGLIRKLQIPFQKLTQYVCALKNAYNAVPYHNWIHACDVTQFVFSCIIRGKLKQYLHDIEIFALLLAAIAHDVDHHGLDNEFHKLASTPLGILYEERPVMEMHHAATAIRLLEMPEHNVLEGIETPEEKQHFFNFFIKIILATDMDKHLAYLKDFEEVTDHFDKRNDRHRLLLAQIILKCGSVANTIRPFEVASDMANLLAEEKYRQGDLERTLKLEVPETRDRTKSPPIATTETSFLTFIATPLFAALGRLIPDLADCSEQLEKNKAAWSQTT